MTIRKVTFRIFERNKLLWNFRIFVILSDTVIWCLKYTTTFCFSQYLLFLIREFINIRNETKPLNNRQIIMKEITAKSWSFAERKIRQLKIYLTIKATIQTASFNTTYRLFCKAYLCFPYEFKIEDISLQHSPIGFSIVKDLKLLSDTGLTFMYHSKQKKI